MIVDLKQIFENIGEKKDVEFSFSPDELKANHHTFIFSSPIEFVGNFLNRAGVITLNYFVKFTLKLVCDRCLEEFEEEFSYSFEHGVVKKLNISDNDDYIECPECKLDLDELILSDIILELPSKVLCKEDCLGLCYICGQNLNEKICNCGD